MNFTRTEWEIILHRLEVGDAIIEVLMDDPNTLKGCFAPEQVDSAIERLIHDGNTSGGALDLIILRECCEGSTFFANIDEGVDLGQLSKSKYYRLHKAADVLETKLNAIVPRG